MFIYHTKAFMVGARSKPSLIRRFSKFDLYGSALIPDNRLRLIPKSGSYPVGFSIGSIKAGIKPESSPQPDLVLVASNRPSNGAAVFTKNEFPTAGRGTTFGHRSRLWQLVRATWPSCLSLGDHPFPTVLVSIS